MYLVIRNFVDIEDKCHRYAAGEEYPRKGYEPTEERIKALAEGNNKAGVKLIKEVKTAEPKEEPKVEPKAEPKEEPKAEPKKAEPKKKTTKKKATPKGGKKASK